MQPHQKSLRQQLPCCRRWATREGKRHLYESGMVCAITALLLLFIAFCSPYWIISWPRVHNGFKRLGLWEVCFAGMVLPTDPTQKAYHGCWWILASEFNDIHSWLFPGWFVWTQIAVTLCFCAEVIGCALLLWVWYQTGGTQMDDKPRKREDLRLVTAALLITFCTALTMGITVLLFAVLFYNDRNWLPMPHINYPSWSFGLAVISTFFSCFSLLCQSIFTVIIRQELREPPKAVPLEGYMPPTVTKDIRRPY